MISATLCEASVLFLVLILLTMLFCSISTKASSIPIDHIVVLYEENRTFDNYFGTYPGANGLRNNIALPVARAPPRKPLILPGPYIPDHYPLTLESQPSPPNDIWLIVVAAVAIVAIVAIVTYAGVRQGKKKVDKISPVEIQSPNSVPSAPPAASHCIYLFLCK